MRSEPLLFETTRFDGQVIAVCRLYSDYDAALAGHAQLVEVERSRLPDPGAFPSASARVPYRVWRRIDSETGIVRARYR